MDDLDRDILRIVQKDNQVSHREIGEAVGLSTSAVRRRLQQLRESKVIEADVSIVNSAKSHITVVTMVTFEEESLESIDRFKQCMLDSPEVRQCYSVAGDIDYILVVQTPDLETYEQWGQENLMSIPEIKRYDSHVAWSRVKFSTEVEM